MPERGAPGNSRVVDRACVRLLYAALHSSREKILSIVPNPQLDDRNRNIQAGLDDTRGRDVTQVRRATTSYGHGGILGIAGGGGMGEVSRRVVLFVNHSN